MTAEAMGLYQTLMGYYTKEKFDLVYLIKQTRKYDDFRSDVLTTIESWGDSKLSTKEQNEILELLIDNLFGYSILTPLITDRTHKNTESIIKRYDYISDIKIHGYNQIMIKHGGITERSEVTFPSKEAYRRFIETVTTKNRVNASNVNAIQRFTDTTTSDDYILRFTLLTPFLTSDNEYKLIIRKVPKDFPEMDDLVALGMMSNETKEYLKNAWQRGGVIISGAPSSGKTTLMNALKEYIPAEKGTLVIQQAEELTQKNHPDMMFIHSIEGRDESETKYDLRDLTEAGLTMDMGAILIGETKGKEARFLMNASYTGMLCGTTVHSTGCETAVDKIVDYALYDNEYSKRELMQMMTGFKTTVFVKDFKVTEISEIVGCENGTMIYKRVTV